MLQFQALAIAITLLLTSTTSWSAIGHVTQQTGPTEIVRKSTKLESHINSPVEMLDTVTTAKAKAELTFEDHTTVKLTEQSKLVIDDFVYDPKKGAGKLSIKVALGTARYASGQIAKTNPQSVSIQTPTASIAVRGTDFSMTVDELGRSLVMLLPSCDEKACVTGAILVSTDAGEVYMDVAYQTTVVTSRTQPPGKPVIVSIDQANINNMLIVTKPKELKEDTTKSTHNELDVNYLNVDFLEFLALDQNDLDTKSALDINLLDTDLLAINSSDILTVQTRAMLTNVLDKTLLPNYDEGTGLKFYFNDDRSHVTLYKSGIHTAYITFDVEQNSTLLLKQDGVGITQQVNKGGTTVINIIQK